MKIGKYYVDAIRDIGIERQDDKGNPVICKGFYCRVYDDPAYGNQVDDFCLAVGHEISDDSDEALEKGIRWYLGIENQAEKEHEKEVDETTDMITAEDIVEQAVYAANTPECCADEQAENMLGMLGANIVEPEIYHSEDECPNHEEAEPDDYKQAVQELVDREFEDFQAEMTEGKTPQEVFDNCRKIFVISELHESICDELGYDDEVYKALYQDRGGILKKLHSAFESQIEPCLGTPGDMTEFIEGYCNENHADIMQGDDDQCLGMGGIS